MEETENIDMDDLYRRILARVEAMEDPFWKSAGHGIVTGGFGACEAFGEPTANGLLNAFHLASRFDNAGVNALAAEIDGWAGGLEPRELAESSEWRDIYVAALKSAAPDTFSRGALLVRGYVAEELEKLA